MKVFALVLLAGFAYSAKLDNTYLPPTSAKTAGGAQFLSTPFNGQPSNFNGQPTNFNGQPTNFNGQPSHQYVSPTVQARPVFQKSFSNFNLPLTSYATPNHQVPSGPSPVYGPANFRSNNPEARANTIRSDNTNDGSGNYQFNYETENKIAQNEQGQLKQVTDGEASVVQGSYSYTGDDGKVYTVNYIADENGFQPVGEHIDQAISSAASDAAKSAAAEGQHGYNYNAQQGYNTQKYQGYSAQQPQVVRNYQGGFNANQQPSYRDNQQGFNGQQGFGGQHGLASQHGLAGQALVAGHQEVDANQEGVSSHQPSFNGQQAYTQQDVSNGGYKY